MSGRGVDQRVVGHATHGREVVLWVVEPRAVTEQVPHRDPLSLRQQPRNDVFDGVVQLQLSGRHQLEHGRGHHRLGDAHGGEPVIGLHAPPMLDVGHAGRERPGLIANTHQDDRAGYATPSNALEFLFDALGHLVHCRGGRLGRGRGRLRLLTPLTAGPELALGGIVAAAPTAQGDRQGDRRGDRRKPRPTPGMEPRFDRTDATESRQ